MTELVQRAQDAGLISRRTSTVDGRVVHLSITPLGDERFQAAFDELGPERQALLRIVRAD